MKYNVNEQAQEYKIVQIYRRRKRRLRERKRDDTKKLMITNEGRLKI